MSCVYQAWAEHMGRILVAAESRFLKTLAFTPHVSQAVALEAAIA